MSPSALTIERGPGRRRHIAGSSPKPIGSVLPLEDMARTASPVVVRRVMRTQSPATEWNSRLLELARGDDIVTWESELLVDDTVVASALEFIQADHEPDQDGEGTMFALLGASYRTKAVFSSLRLSPYITDTRRIGRAKHSRPLLTVTFTTRAPGKPIYLAKHVVDIGTVSLEMLVGPGSGDEG